MFDEAPKKCVRGDYDRRWLSDDLFDLVIWYRPDDTIYGFQLCYGKPSWERALTWMSDRGFSHMLKAAGQNALQITAHDLPSSLVLSLLVSQIPNLLDSR